MANLTQVKLKLVAPEDIVDQAGRLAKTGFKGSDILSALKARGGARFYKEEGDEYESLHLQHDAQHFVFKQGQELIVPEDIAWGLRNYARVFVPPDDPLSASQPSVLVELDKWVPGTSKPQVESDLEKAKAEIEALKAKLAEKEAEPVEA